MLVAHHDAVTHDACRRFALLLAIALSACLGDTAGAASAPSVPEAAIIVASPQSQPSASPSGGLANAPKPNTLSQDRQAGHSLITDREQVLSYAILAFGAAVLVVQYLLLRSPKRDAHEILQLLAINLIVTGTLFLISAGFDSQQIAPGLGLFGTIAGYVLGRRSGAAPKNTVPTDNNRSAP